MKNIINLFETTTRELWEDRLDRFAQASNVTIGEADGQISEKDAKERIERAEEMLYGLFTGKDFAGNPMRPPHIDLQEAMVSSDASIVFPRVISEILLEPVEPYLFLMNNATEEMRLPDKHPLNVEFPSVGILEAFDMPENGEYPSQALAWTQHMQSIRLKKIGLQVPIGDDFIRQSLYPLITIAAKGMKAAVDRKTEGNLYARMVAAAQNVFDNTSDTAAYHTTGQSSAQAKNYTYSYFDLVKMCGVLLGNKYNPTHFLAHPLMWGIFAQDPILRAQFYHGGQLGGSVWTTPPKFEQQSNFPFGISYVPYYALVYNEASTLTGPGSTLASTLISDLYLIDSKNSLFMAHRGPAELDSMEDWYKDAQTMKIKRHLGIASKDAGRGMVSAKNIRNELNYEALYTIRTISS